MSGLEWTPDVSIYRQPWRENTGACLQAPAGEGITMTDRHPGEIDVSTVVRGSVDCYQLSCGHWQSGGPGDGIGGVHSCNRCNRLQVVIVGFSAGTSIFAPRFVLS